MRYLLIVCFLMIVLSGCGSSSATTPAVGTPARIAAFDEGGLAIDPVNVWKSYADRSQGVVARMHNGDAVTVLERSGDAARIRTSTGVEGWLNTSFVR